MAPGQQASAVDMAMEGAEDEEEEGLEAATSTEAAGVADTAMTIRTTDAVADGQEGRGARGGRGRGRGGRGGRGGGAASMKSAGNESESRDDRFPGQSFFVSTQAPAGPENDESFEEPAAVGKVTLHSLDYWVIDSGATYSMTPRADLLTELEPSPVMHVTSALGQRTEVKGMGKAMFKGVDGKMVGLKNVLWVPNLAANLISVRRLQKAGMDTSSKGAKTYTARLGERILWDLHEYRDVYNKIWQIPVVPMPKERQVAASISTKGEAVGSGDCANGRTKEIESKKCNLGGTSKLGEHEESGAAAKEQHKGEENPKSVAEEECGESMWGTNVSAAFSNPTSATRECDWLTLHLRMGHVALPILQQLVKNEMVAGIRVKGEPDEVLGCPTCMQAKFTCFPFSSSEATAKAPLDEVVMDVVGPLKLGAAGAEYFRTIVDVYTRMTWVYVLSKKSDVAETVKTDWLPMVERQQDRLVKAIRTDRGGEFLSKEFSLWLKKNGIRHSLTMPYSPAMNGIAERANRTITETARRLLIEAGLPEYFWHDAVRSACVAKNRALTHVRADKWVPYVEWIGRKLKVDMLRVFGCMCMALVPKHLRHNKLGAKAIWAVHLGMAQNSKGSGLHCPHAALRRRQAPCLRCWPAPCLRCWQAPFLRCCAAVCSLPAPLVLRALASLPLSNCCCRSCLAVEATAATAPAAAATALAAAATALDAVATAFAAAATAPAAATTALAAAATARAVAATALAAAATALGAVATALAAIAVIGDVVPFLLSSSTTHQRAPGRRQAMDLPAPPRPRDLPAEPTDDEQVRFDKGRTALSMWQSRDATACIALTSLRPEYEETHFTQGCTVPQLPTFTASLASTASLATGETATVSTVGGQSRGKRGKKGGKGGGAGGGDRGDEVSGGGGDGLGPSQSSGGFPRGDPGPASPISTTLLCRTVPSGVLSGLHIPSFSENLVGVGNLQECHVGIWFPPFGHDGTCVDDDTYAPQASFKQGPSNSGLFTVHTSSPQVVASGQIAASSQVAASCHCRLVTHPTVLWHHRLAHPCAAALPCLARYNAACPKPCTVALPSAPTRLLLALPVRCPHTAHALPALPACCPRTACAACTPLAHCSRSPHAAHSSPALPCAAHAACSLLACRPLPCTLHCLRCLRAPCLSRPRIALSRPLTPLPCPYCTAAPPACALPYPACAPAAAAAAACTAG
ncbi:unnamed protein product [Closterium sp. NIES-53]